MTEADRDDLPASRRYRTNRLEAYAGLVADVSRAEELRYLNRRLAPGLGGYAAIIVLGIFQPTIAVLGYLAIAIFFLIPLGAFRITRSARSTLPPT